MSGPDYLSPRVLRTTSEFSAALVRCQFCKWHGGPTAPPALIPGYQPCMQSEQAGPAQGQMIALHRPDAQTVLAIPIHTAVQFSCGLWEPDEAKIARALGENTLALEQAVPLRTEPPADMHPQSGSGVDPPEGISYECGGCMYLMAELSDPRMDCPQCGGRVWRAREGR